MQTKIPQQKIQRYHETKHKSDESKLKRQQELNIREFGLSARSDFRPNRRETQNQKACDPTSGETSDSRIAGCLSLHSPRYNCHSPKHWHGSDQEREKRKPDRCLKERLTKDLVTTEQDSGGCKVEHQGCSDAKPEQRSRVNVFHVKTLRSSTSPSRVRSRPSVTRRSRGETTGKHILIPTLYHLVVRLVFASYRRPLQECRFCRVCHPLFRIRRSHPLRSLIVPARQVLLGWSVLRVLHRGK